MSRNLPRARQDLIVKELDNELLIYDALSTKASCLNGSAAVIWKMCDGETTIAQMAERAAGSLGAPIDDAVVLFALKGLQKDGLLEPGFSLSPEAAGVTRAQLMSRFKYVGLAALAVPLVTAIVAPTAAKAYCLPYQKCLR